MKKLLLPVLAACGIMGMSQLFAREVRTPLPLDRDFFLNHYPVQYQWEVQDDECCWNANVAGMGYYRSADAAYSCRDSRCKVPWSTLIFGSADFTLGQAFPNGTTLNPNGTPSIPMNPFVDISQIHPRFEYREVGAMFFGEVGGSFSWCDVNYRFGLRGRLPFRDIDVTNTCPERLFDTNPLSQVWLEALEVVPATVIQPNPTPNKVFAGRLDFLSHLLRLRQIPPQLLVNYRDASQSNQITMASEPVGAAINVSQGLPCVAVIQGATPPAGLWGQQVTAIDGVVNDNGSVTGTRNQFVAATDYTPLQGNTAAQSTLFVVPSLKDDLTMSAGSVKIRDAVETAIADLEGNIQPFIERTGLSFCDGRTKGVGDLDLELFMGRNWGCEGAFWTDVMFGVRFPTGKKVKNCLNLMQQPTGNNGHYEVRLGAAAGYDICSWIKFWVDGSWSWVLRHRECLAAPFKGATVKNIGPCINGDVKWDYFVGHADFSFFASDCCGFDIGYEPYYKRCDRIKLCQTTATDFAGRTGQLLDAGVLEANTKRIAHKVRVGFFTILGDCSIQAGWSHTVAGKNISRDTDWYLTLGVQF